ncbi:MAG TPA: hypothetical protein VMK42_04465 [Anaeromyxobacteraceae bacterium]|nr:hypothetical protein [Anaeromyxobacteraceae bacterium]
MQIGRFPALWTLALGLVGCSALGDLDPEPLSVEPASGYAEVATPVTVRGNRFLVRTTQAAGGGTPTVDATYRVWLGDVPLEGVTWVDVHTLRATVPAGIPAGAQPLVVENSFGRRGRLERAYVAATGPAAALVVAVAASPPVVSVGEVATVTVTATNTGTAAAMAVTPGSLAIATSGGAGASVVGGPTPPSLASLAPGESGTFTWLLGPTAAGGLALGASARGTDSLSGQPVAGSSDAGAAAQVEVQAPASLSATLWAPPSAALGETFEVFMTVTNGGEVAAEGVAAGPLLATGVPATVKSGPSTTLALPAGGSATFGWAVRAGSTPGSLRLASSASAFDANSGQTVSTGPAASGAVAVGRAALAATLASNPSTVSVGQAVTVALRLTNPGSAAVTGVSPTTLGVTPPLGAVTGGPSPASIASLAPGASGTFTWTYTPTGPGRLGLAAGATGSDSSSNSTVRGAASLASAIVVETPAALGAALVLGGAPAPVRVGQVVPLTLNVANAGEAAAVLSSVAPTVSPAASATCAGPSPALPQRVAGASSRTFIWSCTPSTTGSVALGALVSGADANSGLPVVAGSTLTLAALPRTFSASVGANPSTTGVGKAIAVTLTLANSGSAPLSVTGVVPAASPANGAGCGAVSPAPPQTLGSGQQVSFAFSCVPSVAGTVALTATATAAEAGTGIVLSAAPALAASVLVHAAAPARADRLAAGANVSEVIEVAADPLGDGSPAASVNAWRGDTWVGPDRSGRRFARIAAGTRALGPLVALDLGPDPTAGAGAGPTFAVAGEVGGVERLVIAGAHRAGAPWLRAFTDATDLDRAPLDLGEALGAMGVGPSDLALGAALLAGERLYLGYALPAPFGAALVALTAASLEPGAPAQLEASALDAADAPDVGGAGRLRGVTALAKVGDVLYAASGEGILRQDGPPPSAAPWVLATPSSPAWAGKDSLGFSGAPSSAMGDRAVPALASFGSCGAGSCVIAVRNVVGGSGQPAAAPQVWLCRPSGAPGRCLTTDWSLLAPNASGDPLLSQLGDPSNGAASVLVATPRWLYLGFDNAVTGVQLYRAEAAWGGLAGFRGRDGCAAGASGCEGLGGNGFGDPAVTRVFDAKALSLDGATSLWLTAGDGSAPVRVYRVAE